MWSKLLAVGLSLVLLSLLFQSCEEDCDCESWNDVEVSWYDPTTGQSNSWAGNCGDSLSLTVCQGDTICINSTVNCVGNCPETYAWRVTGPQAYDHNGSDLPFYFEPPQAGSYLLELFGLCVGVGEYFGECPACTLNLSVNLSPQLGGDFILIGTSDFGTQGQGNVLLYAFDSSANQIFSSAPTVVASFTGGIVAGLDIFDYDGDVDLDFIALVSFETGVYTAPPESRMLWEFELFLFENIGCLNFEQRAINSTLPQSSYPLADCTAADFDLPTDDGVDFVVAIGNWTSPTEIFKFKNTEVISTPFTQLLGTTITTEDWATHAHRMDSADFNQDHRGDFATYDYKSQGGFKDGIVGMYKHGNEEFGSANDFPNFSPFTHKTDESIATITAGNFTGDSWPDVIVGGDDDDDAGQYWLYENNGSGNFTNDYTKVFDLNKSAENNDNAPGAGTIDAYDFNSDGMMDVIASASNMNGTSTTGGSGKTTIWFVAGNGPGTFSVTHPDTGDPQAPSAIIDIISTATYGTVSSIAAPMTTNFGVG